MSAIPPAVPCTWLARTAFGLGLTGALAACAPIAGTDPPTPRATLQTPLPNVTLRDLHSGQRLSLMDLNQRGLLVDIWASWCEPCKEELPLLDDLATRLTKSGLTVVAVSIDEDRNSALDFLRSRAGWTMRLVHDPGGLLPKALQPSKMPSTYVVDRAGRISKILDGFDRDALQRLERELAGPGQP